MVIVKGNVPNPRINPRVTGSILKLFPNAEFMVDDKGEVIVALAVNDLGK